jgi:hypothetical protein
MRLVGPPREMGFSHSRRSTLLAVSSPPGVDVSFSLVRLAIEPVQGTLSIRSSGAIGRVVTV